MNRTANLPDLNFHYSDFSAWQIENSHPMSEGFWKEQLIGARGINFPYEKMRTEFSKENIILAGQRNIDNKISSVSFDLPQHCIKNLDKLCKDHQLTPYIVFLSCYQRLLSIYAEQ